MLSRLIQAIILDSLTQVFGILNRLCLIKTFMGSQLGPGKGEGEETGRGRGRVGEETDRGRGEWNGWKENGSSW